MPNASGFFPSQILQGSTGKLSTWQESWVSSHPVSPLVGFNIFCKAKPFQLQGPAIKTSSWSCILVHHFAKHDGLKPRAHVKCPFQQLCFIVDRGNICNNSNQFRKIGVYFIFIQPNQTRGIWEVKFLLCSSQQLKLWILTSLQLLEVTVVLSALHQTNRDAGRSVFAA